MSSIADRFKKEQTTGTVSYQGPKLKVGIIGVGWISEAHIVSYLRCPDVQIVAAADLVPGKAVYVVLASGGDTTPEGHFATPVQMAYLMDHGTLVGRLPELNISGDFYDMLGKDYLGAVSGDPQEDSLLCAVTMNVDKA